VSAAYRYLRRCRCRDAGEAYGGGRAEVPGSGAETSRIERTPLQQQFAAVYIDLRRSGALLSGLPGFRSRKPFVYRRTGIYLE